MSVVLDASVTIAWIYPTERTDTIRELFLRTSREAAHVPGLWHLEVANVLQMNVRRQRHDAHFRDATLADLAKLRIHTDEETVNYAWNQTVTLAAKHRLTVYDACYLELAQRRHLHLATLDADLRKAAVAAGVSLVSL